MSRLNRRDDSVFKMLESERMQCERVIARLKDELGKLPTGSMGKRCVKRGGQKYTYPCIRFRDGAKVVFKHLSEELAMELSPLFQRKKKLKQDLVANQVRLQTLAKLLKQR